MAVQHGVPGEWAKVKGTVLSLWPLFLVFTLLGAMGASLILGRWTGIFSAAFFLSVILMAVLWRNGLRRVESFFKGARGEEIVAGILAGLPPDYHVFHDFTAGSFHVDHVVLGPTGVLSIETKYWAGQVTVEEGHVLVDGRLPSRSPVSQALSQSDAVKAVLKSAGCENTVTALVCFASNTCAASGKTVSSVTLLNAHALRAWIEARPTVIAPNDLKRLVQLMETRDR